MRYNNPMSRMHISYMDRIDDARRRHDRRHAHMAPMQVTALIGVLERQLQNARDDHSMIDTFGTLLFKFRKPIRTRRYDALVRLAEMYKRDDTVLGKRARSALKMANEGSTQNILGLSQMLRFAR